VNNKNEDKKMTNGLNKNKIILITVLFLSLIIVSFKSHGITKKDLQKKTVTKHSNKLPKNKSHGLKNSHVTKINKSNLRTSNHIPSNMLSKKEKHLIDFVRNAISNTKYSSYKLGGTKIDTTKGIYIVDCSRYVNHILRNIYPLAFNSLTTWCGTEGPTTYDFYLYFNNLTEDSRHWNIIEDVKKLRPGDIIVFRNKVQKRNRTNGHIMVVMDKPQREGNTFLVRIADSAPSGHSQDTRLSHSSGIGIGTILLKVNQNSLKPYAYAWKEGARWRSNVKFAMARPAQLKPKF
jgi:hypothetical protein